MGRKRRSPPKNSRRLPIGSERCDQALCRKDDRRHGRATSRVGSFSEPEGTGRPPLFLLSVWLDLSKRPVRMSDSGSPHLSARLSDAWARTIVPLVTGDEPRRVAVVGSPTTAKLASGTVVLSPESDLDRPDAAIGESNPRSILPHPVEPRSVEPDPGSSYPPKIHSALIGLTAADPEVPDRADRGESENDMSVENGILFKPENRGSNEPGFDIGEDIARGQEFLKDKTAGHSEVVEEKRVIFFDRRGRRKERLVSRRIVRPNFLLAVEDLKDRRIRQVLITEQGMCHGGLSGK